MANKFKYLSIKVYRIGSSLLVVQARIYTSFTASICTRLIGYIWANRRDERHISLGASKDIGVAHFVTNTIPPRDSIPEWQTRCSEGTSPLRCNQPYSTHRQVDKSTG